MDKYRIEIKEVRARVFQVWGDDEDDAIENAFRWHEHGILKFDDEEDVECLSCTLLEPVETKIKQKTKQ